MGGGLLPIAVDQLLNAVTDIQLSGASPLPQGTEPGPESVHEERNQDDDWDRYTEEEK